MGEFPDRIGSVQPGATDSHVVDAGVREANLTLVWKLKTWVTEGVRSDGGGR